MDKIYKVELTETAIHNMLNSYVDHRKQMSLYEEDDETESAEYAFHLACCETAEDWMRLIGISPSCKYIEDQLMEGR